MAKRNLEYYINADISEALKAFNKMEKKVERFGRNMRNTGRDIAALTAPFAALGAIGVKEALEFERSFAKIRAGTGATGDALKGLVKDFEAVNKQVSQGDEVVAQALADVNTRLGLTGSALQETTKSFMDLSRIMGVDSSQLITSATQAMNNWGVSANEATSFLDKLYTASYTMGIGVNELAAQVSGTGATFRNMGLSIEETIALIASFEKAGLNAGAMIMPLNTAMAKLQKEGVKDLGAGLNSVIASIKNAKTNSEAMGIAVEYFGRRGAALGSAIREGRFEIDALVDSLKNSNGQLSKAAIDTMTAGESFKLLKKNAEDALEPVGKELMKLALDYAPKAQKAIEWLGSESGLQTIKIGLITTAVSGVIAILGDLVIKIGAVSKALLALGSNPYFWV
ncbi:MAG: phage tail tape measure protein, partial [Synergistaceae bacterium]|nr:phage tail tape measure protein [Synergistaceae bacterium]